MPLTNILWAEGHYPAGRGGGLAAGGGGVEGHLLASGGKGLATNV